MRRVARDSSARAQGNEEGRRLQQTEGYFDEHLHGDSFSVGPERGFEAPLADLIHSSFFQTQAGALDYLDVRGAPVWRDHDLQHHRALVFRLAGFVGVQRQRAIRALRITHTAGAWTKYPAARAPARTRPQASAGAAPDASAFARADASSAAGPAGTCDQL